MRLDVSIAKYFGANHTNSTNLKSLYTSGLYFRWHHQHNQRNYIV